MRHDALKTVATVLATIAVVSTPVLAQRGQRGAAATAVVDAPPSEAAPRWPDGRVNLGSTSDKKGYWEVRPGLGGAPRPADVPFQPWTKALQQYRAAKTDL